MRRVKLVLNTLSLGCIIAAYVYGQAGQQQTAPATLTINGDIPSPLVLSIDDLAKMPRETVSVPDHDGTTVAYEGVLLREILKKAGAPMEALRGKALASYILAKAHDGYQVVFTLAEVAPQFANEAILVADKRGGKALLESQGPFRLVCPTDKAGARSVRMLETLEIVQLRE